MLAQIIPYTSVTVRRSIYVPYTKQWTSRSFPLACHFSTGTEKKPTEEICDNYLTHPWYTTEELENIEKTHHVPTKLHERLALKAVGFCRKSFDFATSYKGPGGKMTKDDWITRCLFLETIAGVPGMVGGMCRHFKSLRAMRRDNGWIHTLLEEAENERMHLLSFLKMKEAGFIMRAAVLVSQAIFFNAFFATYLFHPKSCHRFVGYLEEEAVKTYTGILSDIHDGYLEEWKTQKAPPIAQKYWKLSKDGTVEEMIKCIRADEANHRDVNHTLAGLDQKNDINPFIGKHHEKQEKANAASIA